MKRYFRVMLGKGSMYAQACFADKFIGADYDIHQDLTGKLPDEWREFNKEFIPVFLAGHPGKSKISAGLACGALYTLAKGIQKGDTILSPDGQGNYRVGEVTSNYFYKPDQILPHRRTVQWSSTAVARNAMSEALQNSTGSIAAVCDITAHANEIEKHIADGHATVSIVATNPEIEDPAAFAMEAHLQDFLIKNWDQTELGKTFAVFEEDGEPTGKEYPTAVGSIDILAVSKDNKRLLVIELKRGRASDVVVGQALRYMGWVKEQLAETNQTVEGMIIALEDDPKLRWAISMVPNLAFYRYEISFKLTKA